MPIKYPRVRVRFWVGKYILEVKGFSSRDSYEIEVAKRCQITRDVWVKVELFQFRYKSSIERI